MQILIKALKGQDCMLNVTGATTILEIKQQIEHALHVPLANQKLLLLGRTLSDESTVESYPKIKDGTKINLIVMRPEGLRDQIHRSFRKFYNEQQADRLTNEFMTDFEKKLKQLSLDDIERLADNLLNS